MTLLNASGTRHLLQMVERLLPEVDPDLAIFLNNPLALIEGMTGNPHAAFQRLRSLPPHFQAMATTWSTWKWTHELIRSLSADEAISLSGCVPLSERVDLLIRAAAACKERGELDGARRVVGHAQGLCGGWEPLVRECEDSSLVDTLAEIVRGEDIPDPDPLERALFRLVSQFDPVAEQFNEWEPDEERDPRPWLHTLSLLVRLRLQTFRNIYAAARPFARLAPALADGSVVWEILRRPGSRSVLCYAHAGRERIRMRVLTDILEAQIAAGELDGARAILDLLSAEPPWNPWLHESALALARAHVGRGELARVRELVDSFLGPVHAEVRAALLCDAFARTGERWCLEQAIRWVSEDPCSDELQSEARIVAALAVRGETEEALARAERMPPGDDRLNALHEVARAYLRRCDPVTAAALLERCAAEDESMRADALERLACLQLEHGLVREALATTLAMAPLPVDHPRAAQTWVLYRQAGLVWNLARAGLSGPERPVPAWVPTLRDPFLRAVALLSLAHPAADASLF